MKRKTKIVATIGPASESADVLEQMILAGMNVARLNFSHGSHDEQLARWHRIQEVAKRLGKVVTVLADIQGPKIRVSRFKDGPITLNAGDEFVLDADLDVNAGDQHQVGLDYKNLPKDVGPGDILLLNDGLIQFKVKRVEGNRVINEVIVGGVLSNNKGINRKGGGLTAKMLTEKDLRDLEFAVKNGADYIAVSFPRSAEDILEAKKLIQSHGGKSAVVAKIERTEAVAAIDEIIEVSDGLMVARGDLGVEIGVAEVPAVQKHMIRRCRELNKFVITATQMMETMIDNAMPTRAEVSDVANAVLDGTDAVMLSAESAAGKHPALVVQTMDRVCKSAEKHEATQPDMEQYLARSMERVDQAIAMSSMFVSQHLNIKAIVTLTESGQTALTMSRIHSNIPIYGLSRHELTLQQMNIYRNVYPIAFDLTQQKAEDVNQAAVQALREFGVVADGDLIVLTRGDLIGTHGGTNMMKIVRVGEEHQV